MGSGGRPGFFGKKYDHHECLGLRKAEELERDLNDLRKQNSFSHERLFDRLNDLERQEGIQGEQFKHIIEKLTDLTSGLSDIKEDSKQVISQLPPLELRVKALEKTADDVDELKEKPGKKWESASNQIIALIIAAVVGFFLSKMGM